jgi:hypothetical protein
MMRFLHDDLDYVDELLSRYFPLACHEEEISIAVGPVILHARMPYGFSDTLMPRYNGFSCDYGNYDFLIEVAASAEIDLAAYSDIYVKSRPGGKVHYAFRWDFISRIDIREETAVILIAPIGTPLCVDTILRISTSFVAVQKGGFLLHSATVGTDLGAFIFSGISGAGKSTIAKLSMNTYDVLTDEMSLVEKTSSGFKVWGTPFWGELQLSVNRSSPLKALFLLFKAPYNSIEDVPSVIGLPEFMKIVLFFGQNKELFDKLLNLSIDFLQTVPIKKLNFLPESSLWEVIYDEFG